MSKPSPTLIGAFVVGALALIVSGILFFGGNTVFEKRLPIVSFFPDSVNGLQIGAPVTFRGVQVGKVKSIGIRLTRDPGQPLIQVNMELLPKMVAVHGQGPALDENLVPKLVSHGLTAQLVTQSLVTGLLNVELAFRPQANAFRVGDQSAVAEVPTVPGAFAALSKQLESVDVAGLMKSMQQTLASLDGVLQSPELAKTVRDLPRLVGELRHTVGTVDREVVQFSGAGRQAFATSAAELQQTLASARTLLADIDREASSTLGATRDTLQRANTALGETGALLDPYGPKMIQVERTIDDLAATAARLRNLAERVDRNPSILVWGK
jgi:paraquat-inducible protein B